MATQIKSWQIVDGKLVEIQSKLSDFGRKESYDLEEWIASNSSIVEQDLIVIGRQVQTASGPSDLLAIDSSGNIVVIELKRDKLPREALAQAIDYASDISSWSLEKISEVFSKYSDKSLEDVISESFPEHSLESLNINNSQRIVLVGFAIESSLERMITWLSDTYDVDINAVILHYTQTGAGDEILTRTAVLSEEIVEQRAKRKKFQIPMSDEPGEYDEKELSELLVQYLSQNMVTPKRIKEILLPMCLETEYVTRDALKREIVARGEAEDLSKAGYSQSVISSQIGLQKNDFLRQVVGYGYPNNPWEKDDYFIRSEYKDFVRDILYQLDSE